MEPLWNGTSTRTEMGGEITHNLPALIQGFESCTRPFHIPPEPRQ